MLDFFKREAYRREITFVLLVKVLLLLGLWFFLFYREGKPVHPKKDIPAHFMTSLMTAP